MNFKSEGQDMSSATNIPAENGINALNPSAHPRLGVPPHTAGEAIQLAIDAAGNLPLKSPSPGAVSPHSQARAVLALLLNCYVHQIYSSRNAADLAARDPDFPWLWWEDFPNAATLRRFRVENHSTIHRCLTAALEMLAAKKKFAGALTKINGLQFAEEASRRITMAAFVDSVELEED